jgi:hypothetical protein
LHILQSSNFATLTRIVLSGFTQTRPVRFTLGCAVEIQN